MGFQETSASSHRNTQALIDGEIHSDEAIKYQLREPKSPKRGTPSFSLVLHGLRIVGFHSQKKSNIRHLFAIKHDISYMYLHHDAH